MNRLLFVALIATLCFTCTAKADDKLPPAVKPIVDKAVRDVRKNLVEFSKANAKPLAEARKALEELSTKLIKEGKSMEAQAVLKKVDTLDEEIKQHLFCKSPSSEAGHLASMVR